MKNIKEIGKNILLEIKNNLEEMGAGRQIMPANTYKNAIKCWKNGQKTINQNRDNAISSSENQTARAYKYARADVSV